MVSLAEDIERQVDGWRRYRSVASNLKLYAEFLEARGLPLILELTYLSDLTGVDEDIVGAIIGHPQRFYRTFELRKRRGGTRRIDAPIPSLLKVQRWISQNLLDSIETHPAAKAYRSGVGLLDNVRTHVGHKQLLKLDLVNFFDSINQKRVITVFQKMGYLHRTAYQLSQLCCLNGNLPQGACTSPQLSNIIAKRLDRRLSALAQKFDLNYTRYSDDLTFSGEKIPTKLISLLHVIAEEEGFEINKQKTRLYTGTGKRIVTGVTVHGTKPNLPKAKRRQIRQDFYEFVEKDGFLHILSNGGGDVFVLDRLRGQLAFWAYIDPDAAFPIKAIKRLEQFEMSLR